MQGPISLILSHPHRTQELELHLAPGGRGGLTLGLQLCAARPAHVRRASTSPLRTQLELDAATSASLRAWMSAISPEQLGDVEGPSPELSCVITTWPSGRERRACAGPVRGAHLDLVSLLATTAQHQLGRVALREAGLRELLQSVATTRLAQATQRRTPPPPPSLEARVSAPSLGLRLVVSRSPEGTTVHDGARTLRLEPDVADGAACVLQQLVSARTARVGTGECVVEVEVGTSRVEVRCPGDARGLPRLEQAAAVARPALQIVFGLAASLAEYDPARRAVFLARSAALLPLRSRPVRIDDLTLRVRINDEPRMLGERWYRIETHGTLMRCDGASSGEEGIPTTPITLAPASLDALREALRVCEAAGAGPDDAWPEDGSLVELCLQQPARGPLETTTLRWAFGPMAPPHRSAAATRAIDAAKALHTVLRAMREPAQSL